MRIGALFGNTLRETPGDVESVSHRLALRAGLIRPLAAGVHAFLPLGYRVVRRIEAIMREEMEALGAQEMLMPVLNPAELWRASGRWETCGPVLMHLEDRSGRLYALATGHEETVADLARREVRSYRDLPRVVYHIQTKLRDEPHPRGGLLRAREFRTKDAYSLHADAADLDQFYPQMLEAYRRIFARCGLPCLLVEADAGMVDGAGSHEFLLPHPAGEGLLIRCPSCGYAANAESARFRLPPAPDDPLEEMRLVATPDCPTIADVAAFVGVPTWRTLKAVFYTWQPVGSPPMLLFVVIRGDLEVNEARLLSLLGDGTLRPATADEIRAAGAEPGYASPVGLKVRRTVDGEGLLVVADRSIQVGANFVAGANREGHHLVGVNPSRDFDVTLLADVAQARAGHLCPRCEQALTVEPAIELGHCFKLGVRYSQALGATYLDANGQEQPIVMGSYGIDVGRLLAAVIEVHHDEHGIVWPPSLAPFDVHLISLAPSGVEAEAAERLYALLRAAGYRVLFDDRSESAGVKFADADLIGCPVRVTIGRRSLEAGGAEVKARWEAERQVCALDDLPGSVAALLDRWPSV